MVTSQESFHAKSVPAPYRCESAGLSICILLFKIIMSDTKDKKMWFDIDRLLSYNATLNFVIAERGVGKTFGCKKKFLERFLKSGEEFVYIRRYKTELELAYEGFWTQLQDNGCFDDLDLKVKQSRKKITKFTCDGVTCGYGIPLSTANILKSSSFSKVKNIMFDEFLIDNGTYHYLRNEVIQFLEVIETIARLRDVRVVLLGNAISVVNPYFEFFNISLPYNSEYKTYKDGEICVNYVKNEVYREVKKNSRFGKLIADTEYGMYAIDNKFLRDDNAFISKRDPQARVFSTIILNGNKYGVWRNWKTGHVYISKDFEPSNPCIFAFDVADHNENTIYTKARNSNWFGAVIEAYKMGVLHFETQSQKKAFIGIIGRCLV